MRRMDVIMKPRLHSMLLLLTGLMTGVFVSIGQGVFAERETSRATLPVEELRTFSDVFGRIKNDYLPNVRGRIEAEVGIAPMRVMINASHCHGLVAADIEERTVRAVKQAKSKLVPVTVGVEEESLIEVSGGALKAGDLVVVRGNERLRPGQTVRLRGATDAAETDAR